MAYIDTPLTIRRVFCYKRETGEEDNLIDKADRKGKKVVALVMKLNVKERKKKGINLDYQSDLFICIACNSCLR